MFDKFESKNKVTAIEKDYLSQFNNLADQRFVTDTSLGQLFQKFSGASVHNGLFRLHTPGAAYFWTSVICRFFAGYADRVLCFASDWMGRQYALAAGADIIYVFDPATVEVYELHTDLAVFLNDEFDDIKNEDLNGQLFQHLIQSNGALKANECFGFKKFLFLGGKDELENYELSDMEVYWEISLQVFNKIKDLPDGTRINKISME